MHPKIKQLIEDDLIGSEPYMIKREGGQSVGVQIVGWRLWYPKDDDFPDVDIRIRQSRSQYENREMALNLLELVINP